MQTTRRQLDLLKNRKMQSHTTIYVVGSHSDRSKVYRNSGNVSIKHLIYALTNLWIYMYIPNKFDPNPTKNEKVFHTMYH